MLYCKTLNRNKFNSVNTYTYYCYKYIFGLIRYKVINDSIAKTLTFIACLV